MKYENNNFCVNYNEKDKAYIADLLEALNENASCIMDFFEIIELKQKKVVNLWDSTNEYANYIKPYVGEYQEWIVADTFDKNINILSYDLYVSRKSHKDRSISDYKKVLIHEFVHACQQEINPDANSVFWFWEALATNLSKQKYSIVDIPYSKSELMYNFNKLKYAYSVSYTIGRYLLESYPNSYILEYVKNPSKLIDDTEIILERTKFWVQSNRHD